MALRDIIIDYTVAKDGQIFQAAIVNPGTSQIYSAVPVERLETILGLPEG